MGESQKPDKHVIGSPAPLMLAYSWPIVPYTSPMFTLCPPLVESLQTPACLPSLMLPMDSFPLTNYPVYKRLAPSDQETISCKKSKSDMIWPILPVSLSVRQILGQKRKMTEDCVQETKRVKLAEDDVLHFSFYTYEVTSPPVTPLARCLATPSLCCPTSQVREVSPSLFREVEQDLLDMDDGAYEVEEENGDPETVSYFGDFDLPVKFTQIPRQVSLTCLQRPGLCERQSKYIHTSSVPDFLVAKFKNEELS